MTINSSAALPWVGVGVVDTSEISGKQVGFILEGKEESEAENRLKAKRQL